MRNQLMLITMIVGVVLFLSVLLGAEKSRSVQAHTLLVVPSSTPSIHSSNSSVSTSPHDDTSTRPNPAIIAAWIGLGGLLGAAIITGLFGLYQIRHNRQLQRERLRSERRQAQDLAHLQNQERGANSYKGARASAERNEC